MTEQSQVTEVISEQAFEQVSKLRQLATQAASEVRELSNMPLSKQQKITILRMAIDTHSTTFPTAAPATTEQIIATYNKYLQAVNGAE